MCTCFRSIPNHGGEAWPFDAVAKFDTLENITTGNNNFSGCSSFDGLGEFLDPALFDQSTNYRVHLGFRECNFKEIVASPNQTAGLFQTDAHI